jgi:hypothetical protein
MGFPLRQRSSLAVLVAVTLLTGALPAGPAKPEPAAPSAPVEGRGPTLGLVQGRSMWAVRPPARKGELFARLVVGTRTDQGEWAVREYAVPGHFYSTVPYRWRVAHGCFWGTGGETLGRAELTRIPLGELRFHDETDEEGLLLYRRKYPNDYGYFCHLWQLRPVAQTAQTIIASYHLGADPSTMPKVFVFDFLPVGPTSCLLFVMIDSEMSVWRGEARWVVNEIGSWVVEWGRERVETFAAGFREPFVVYAHGPAYVFLTRSGKLYLARKPARGDRKVEPLWVDAQRPIVAAVTDADRGTTYLFAKNQQAIINAKDCYFALAEKPQIVEFSPLELKPVKAPEPLQTVAAYARLLAK